MNWTQAIQQAVRDVDTLCTLLELDPAAYTTYYAQPAAHFPLEVPHAFIARMQRGNWHDPLLRQVLAPLPDPNRTLPVFLADPVQEQTSATNPLPGLLRKYPGRVLIVATGRCAIHCQYCFRQHFPYDTQSISQAHWQTLCAYIQSDPEIHEVIFSGGDPLIRPDPVWEAWLAQLAAIPHVQTVRFHTRLPVVIPERITPEWVRLLQRTRLRAVVVLHSNHPQEWDQSLITAVRSLTGSGITVLNQGVLLDGINTDLDCLITMSHTVWQAGVLPYYWHVLDPVAGAEGYATDLTPIPIWEQTLRDRLPGYLVPRFVREVPGAASKQPVG